VQRIDDEPRPLVLHLCRDRPDVEHAGGEAGARGVRDELWQRVVERRLEDERDPADLAHHVDRSDLVEMHVLRDDAVDALLASASRGYASWARRRALGQPGAVDPVADRAPVPVRLARRRAHGRLRRGDAAPDGVLVRARVKERAKQHVAGRVADAVHVRGPRHGAPPAARAMRAATVPALKPSSMLTTATPAAQEVSIASSALTPPNAAP
jgi:hypothetical protein